MEGLRLMAQRGKRVEPPFRQRVSEAARTLPAFFNRLSRQQQREYLLSDGIGEFPVQATEELIRAAKKLWVLPAPAALKTLTENSQAVATALCTAAGISPPRVQVRGVRPRSSRSELYGLCYPLARPPLIIVWARTARRHQPVRMRTFVRTLAHELAHYLDYRLLGLSESFHTQGFFRRESFLVRLLIPADS